MVSPARLTDGGASWGRVASLCEPARCRFRRVSFDYCQGREEPITVDRSAAVIRRAEVTDLPNIEAVARATWPVAYAGVIPSDVQRRLLSSWYSPVALTRALGAQESVFLVAELGGSVVGFAQYVRRSTELVELTRIYVLPERQGSGVGTQLLEAGLAALAQQGVTSVKVSVERDNAVGRRFYRRTGFTEIRELTQEVEGYRLRLVECHRSIRGRD